MANVSGFSGSYYIFRKLRTTALPLPPTHSPSNTTLQYSHAISPIYVLWTSVLGYNQPTDSASTTAITKASSTNVYHYGSRVRFRRHSPANSRYVSQTTSNHLALLITFSKRRRSLPQEDSKTPRQPQTCLHQRQRRTDVHDPNQRPILHHSKIKRT